MTTKTKRKIISIDKEKCNGCGACIDSCAEGALDIVDGKAKLVKEIYCDGLAACLKECPQGALSIVEREADEFDEEATRRHLADLERKAANPVASCPGSAMQQFGAAAEPALASSNRQESQLTHWPVQLTLVPPNAPFLKNADIVLLADCVPVAYPNLHQDFLKGRAVLVACPKLDDFAAHQAKLTDILQEAGPKSLTVVHMEVPCCSGLAYMARKAIADSGIQLPFKEVTIGIKGTVKAEVGAL